MASAGEILALNVENLDLELRRTPVRSNGGDVEFVYWDTGTAHLLPQLLRLPDGTTRTCGAAVPGPVLLKQYTVAAAVWSSTSCAAPRRPTSAARRSRCS